METIGEYVALTGIFIPRNARNRYGLGTPVPYTYSEERWRKR